MPTKKLKKEKPVFTAKRKPTAPPTRKIGKDRPESKVHPAGRAAKHKKRDGKTED